MSTKETIQSGDNVKVPGCDKSKNATFCLVSTAIESRQERNDNGIPLSGPTCGCVRKIEEVEKIPPTLE